METFLGNVERLVEVAEHNDWHYGSRESSLVVFDSTLMDRHYGILVEVEPAAEIVGGWVGYARDGVGNAGLSWGRTREQAIKEAIDTYKRIVDDRYGI